MEQYGHSSALGLKYRGHGDDWAELIMPWRADLVGDISMQTMATGAITGLLDMAAGMSVWTRLGAFRPQATLDIRIDYLRPAKAKADMFGRVECYRTTRQIAFVRGIAHDGDPDDAVAHMAACFMFTGDVMAPRGSTANPLPPHSKAAP